MSYAEDLKHPKWQEKRLRVLERARFKCERCADTERSLHAHHKIYLRGHKPWEYEDYLLECLCEVCHGVAHREREELDLIVARQATATVPWLANAMTNALISDEFASGLPVKVRAALKGVGDALIGRDTFKLVDAQNVLQDAIDEVRDLQRGPGGETA
jgi:hypothetical protein